MTAEPIAILRPHGVAALPTGLTAEARGGLCLVSGPAAPRGVVFGHRARRGALLRHAARRQGWLEALMTAGPVLPLRPGTALDAAGLATHAGLFNAWLDRLEDRVQLQLTVRWDREAARGQFATAHELVGIAQKPGLDRLAARLAAAMQAELDVLELDAIPLPIAEDDMLLNRVLLIAAGAEPALDAAVDRIDALWPEGLRLRLVGPSPAVSFALAGLRALPLGDLRAAAAVLGLPPPATGAELAALAAGIAPARRRALAEGPHRDAVPAAAATLAAAAAAGFSPGALPDPLLLPEVIRDGRAQPVDPGSLPAPALPPFRDSA